MLSRIFRRLRYIGTDLVVGVYAFRHPSTPLSDKWLLLGIALYLLSPVDLVPDIFPVFGWLDDLALASFALPRLLKCLPPNVLREARQRAGSGWMRVFHPDKM